MLLVHEMFMAPFKLCTKYDHIDTICLKISVKIELASIPIL